MIRMSGSRVTRLRAPRNDDEGFALIFVLFMSMIIMMGTAATLAVASNAIKPARQNQDTAAAQAAAQAGVQAYLANLDANCRPSSANQCSWLQNQGSTPIVATLGTQKYSTYALNATSYYSAGNNNVVRLVSSGYSPAGSTNQVKQQITVDVSSAPSPLSVAYFSNYETVGSSFLNSYYDPRTIALSKPAVLSALGLPVASSVTWDGASLSGTKGASGLGDNVCDKLWYNDPSNKNDGDSDTTGRSALLAGRTGLPTATDYAEGGTETVPAHVSLNNSGVSVQVAAQNSQVTRYAPCQTTFTNGQTFNGPVYSRDAFYLSNGSPKNSTGPSFVVPQKETYPALWTGWTTSSVPAAPSANPYRSFPIVGGKVDPSSGTVASSPYAGLSLPSTTGITSGTCTFSGPTQISLSGSTATVTSPLTDSAGASCPGTVAGHVYTVPITTTTLYVGDSTRSVSNPFNLQGTNLTYYSPSAGDAYVSSSATGLTSGKVSIVASDDVIVTGSVLAKSNPDSTTSAVNGEPSWETGSPAIDLVATNDVRVYHPVTCAGSNTTIAPTGGLSATATNGWCSNDITGLYTTANAGLVLNSDNTLNAATHPSLQYSNAASATEPSEIDAAIFALNGSFYADNFNRGPSVGSLIVNGGVYENHHGLLGEEWETPTSSTATRPYSGFKLTIKYLSYVNAGLGYVPELSGGSGLDPWQVVSTSSGGS